MGYHGERADPQGRAPVSENMRRLCIALILAALAFCVVLLITGCCRGSVQPVPPAPDPVKDLAGTLIWAGGIAGFAGMVLGFASWLPAGFLGPAGAIVAIAAPFSRLIGYVGGAAFLCGWGISWLGRHPWVVVLSVIIAGLAWYLHRHPAIGGRVVGWIKTHTHKTIVKG